ncbi:hypothetical protein [Mariniblastus fucicola]|uniref:Uncharacterized protein n=1 Tax=Mariniblastus fucicola TaxID=980251 RepID=A0A5B9PDM1_9BACT|nr:hypothetical protein [Mariniblastus fucicola]QEG23200.1 hypothetical protein MFFC18_30960 [Mariniblastus fucicola]
MKNRICALLFYGLLIVFAGEGVIKAQSPGEASRVEVPRGSEANSRIEMLRKTSAELATRIENLHDARKNRLAEFREKAISDISFEDVFRMLHVQKVELAIELEGLNARLELLERKISSSGLENESALEMQRDLLKRYVANQSERLELTMRLVKKGAASQADQHQAEQLLAEAQLRLGEFEVKSEQASPALAHAMFEVSLEIAEKKAKQSMVEKMLKKYIDSREDFNELRKFDGEIEDAMELRRKLSRELVSPQSVDTDF